MSDSPNFLTYAQTAFDSFDERPFCAVDSLVFAWLSYLRLPQDMSELEGWQGLDVRELLRACYYAIDKKPLSEAELNFGERELMKIVLKKIRGTDIELLLKESGLIE